MHNMNGRKLMYWRELLAAGQEIERLLETSRPSNIPGQGPVFDVMMPNGKRFGDCTFEEVSEFGRELLDAAPCFQEPDGEL
jgi:hypothetical protein